MDAIRVLIADDHPIVRSGLRTAISVDPFLQVVGEAANGQEAIDRIGELDLHVAVLDISMPVLDGIAATREIRKRNSKVGIILLTAHQGDDLFRAAVEAGANGYLMKDNALLEITNGIRAIASGGYYFTHAVGQVFRPAAASGAQAVPQSSSSLLLTQLVPVERRIVEMIAAHSSTKEIASELGLSIRTIENRRALICEKLGISGTNALLKFALANKGQLA